MTHPRAAVITIVHGRHRHLQRQLVSLDDLATSDVLHHVVVAMGDDGIAPLVRDHGSARPDPDRPDAGIDRTVATIPVGADGELPLAAARNLGAEIGLERGADLLVFLDVDCLAHRDLITDYRAAVDPPHSDGREDAPSPGPLADPPHSDGRANEVSRDPDTSPGPILWCGQVRYLPPLPPGIEDYPREGLQNWASPHPARPVLPAGTTRLSDDVRLFWSLNFAVTADDWRTIGGFHPGYRGYGGEDTDFATGVAALGGGLGWIGGADAFHQHHPTSSPPWQHLAAIVRNATVFRDRWGWFPMEGWLTAFAAEGAVDYRPDDGVLTLNPGHRSGS